MITSVKGTAALVGPPTVVVVTGVPGAGKTTLGAALATELDAPFISLDFIKERLDPAGGWDPRELRLAAEKELSAHLDAVRGTVVVDIWIAPHRDTARIASLLSRKAVDIVEVLCRVSADIAVGRYAERSRSAPHRPPDAATLARIRAAVDEIESLPVGRCIEVDTSERADVKRLIERINR